MPRQVKSLHDQKTFALGVMGRADHHANQVKQILAEMNGWILMTADDIEVRDVANPNVLWFIKGDERYAVSYDHHTQAIEVREHTLHGKVMLSANNKTSRTDIQNFFESI